MFTFSEKKYFSFVTTLAFFFFLMSVYNSIAQPNTWVVVYGGFNYDRGKGICQTYDKGFAVCGSSASFGQGNTDFYLLKIDEQGKYKWQNSFGGINLENCFSIQQTNDSGFVLCGYSNSFGTSGYDAYIVKTDSLGNLQWQKNYGSNDWDFTYWAEQTQDSGYIIAGETYNNTMHAYLIKTNSDGDTLWTKRYGGTNSSGFKEVHQTPDNGYIAAGYLQVSPGNKDFFVVRTDANGDTLWTKQYGSLSNDSCNSIALCKDKGFLLAGNRDTLTKHKALFYKMDSLGNIIQTVFEKNASGNRSISHIIESVEGDYVLIANTDVGGLGGQEIRMDKYNPGGWWVWGRSFGGTADDESYHFIQAQDSGYALVGYTASYGLGPDNVYIAKTNSVGSYSTTVNSYVSVKEENAEQKSIAIYPNPSAGKFNVSGEKIIGIRIYNIIGGLIYESERRPINTIDISDQPNGIYMMVIKLENGLARRKIIVSR